jgi:hypothetical protein
MDCYYKKNFLKDLVSIPEFYQKRIEMFVLKKLIISLQAKGD